MAKALAQFDALPAVFQARCTRRPDEGGDAGARSRAHVLPGRHATRRRARRRLAIGDRVQGRRRQGVYRDHRCNSSPRRQKPRAPMAVGLWPMGRIRAAQSASEPFMRPAAEVGRVQLPIEIAKAGVLAEADLAARAL
jgi:hypothetical protein